MGLRSLPGAAKWIRLQAPQIKRACGVLSFWQARWIFLKPDLIGNDRSQTFALCAKETSLYSDGLTEGHFVLAVAMQESGFGKIFWVNRKPDAGRLQPKQARSGLPNETILC